MDAGRGVGRPAPAGTHSISFYCDRIEPTVAELRARGVEVTGPVVDAGFGLITVFKMPGGVEVEWYQPHYTKKPYRANPRCDSSSSATSSGVQSRPRSRLSGSAPQVGI